LKCQCFGGYSDVDCSIKLNGCGDQNCTGNEHGGSCLNFEDSETEGYCKCH
jgi:hypothetical protein